MAINVANPFTYSSGAKSPVYCDNRLIISYTDKRRAIVEAMIRMAHAVGLRVTAEGVERPKPKRASKLCVKKLTR